MIMKHSIILHAYRLCYMSLIPYSQVQDLFSLACLSYLYVTLSYKYVILEMGFEPMHTICTKPQPRCSPTELLK